MDTSTGALIFSLISLCLLAGCDSAKSDWADASTHNTISAYQGFLSAHPNDVHVSEAHTLILQLQDNKAWEDAQTTSSVPAYQGYLQRFPHGTHAPDASREIEAMDRSAAWTAAQNANTPAAIQGFLDKYPAGVESDQARVRLKQLTGYRAHITTASSQAQASRKLARLKSRLGSEASTLQITEQADGKHFSIDSGGMSDQAARQTCDAIWHAHEDCQVVESRATSGNGSS